jgi:uncharacterized protein
MDIAVNVPALIVLGVAVGLVAGMFGVGGGFLLTPLLSVVLRVPLPIAVGTGLCQIIGTATVALLRHKKLGQGELRVDVLMIAGSLIGVSAGARTVSALEHAGSVAIAGGSIPLVNLVLYGLFAVLLAASSWIFWRQGRKLSDALDEARPGPLARLRFGPSIDLPRVPMRGVSAVGIAYLGVVLGFVSGLLGIGGGVVLLPVLVYGFGFPVRQAAGTGILALLVTAAVGTVEHALAEHVHLGMACVLLIGSTLSAQLGALLTRRLAAHTLRRTFAVLLWITIAAIVWDVARRLAFVHGA